jgi:hypothetical protein
VNIKFQTKPLREVDCEEDLVVNGEVVGYMKTYVRESKNRYHAGFKLKGGLLGLIQGHGETKEEAILAAIETGKKDSLTLLESIAALETKLSA